MPAAFLAKFSDPRRPADAPTLDLTTGDFRLTTVLDADAQVIAERGLAAAEEARSLRERTPHVGADGTIWTTWNYPFALNLKLAPEWRTNGFSLPPPRQVPSIPCGWNALAQSYSIRR